MSKYQILAAAVVTVVILLGFLWPTETAHKRLYQGECRECHANLEYVKDPDAVSFIAPAESHTEQFKRYTHGKDNYVAGNCTSCHQKAECQSCHSKKPETHMSGFTKPFEMNAGFHLHSNLGKANPGGCLTCHQDSAATCTECHSSDTVFKWQEGTADNLAKWRELLK